MCFISKSYVLCFSFLLILITYKQKQKHTNTHSSHKNNYKVIEFSSFIFYILHEYAHISKVFTSALSQAAKAQAAQAVWDRHSLASYAHNVTRY